jgi:hypothetical protein
MTTDQVIQRAIEEGVSEQQITRALDLWLETNAFRAAQGCAPMPLEDVMPRYEVR